MSQIVPSILTSSESDYVDQLRKAEHVCDLIQIDVVDGKFSKNITIGSDVIKKYPSSKSLEIQLMVLDVGSFVKELVALEYVSRIIFPVEMRGDVNEIFYLIQKHDKQVGLSLNPKTPVKKLENFIDDIDLVLFLAVEPGFSGQKLIESVFEKIDRVKKLNRNVAIEVDGGVNFENVSRLAKSGVDFLAVNSALYKADDFYLTYEKLDKLVNYPQ